MDALLIEDLNNNMSVESSAASCCKRTSKDAGVKLMCEFWNILKQEPNFNLSEAVQEKVGVKMSGRSAVPPQQIACYMACNDIRKASSGRASPRIGAGCCDGGAQDIGKVLSNINAAASFDANCSLEVKKLVEKEKTLQNQVSRLEEREKKGVELLKQADRMWSTMENEYKKKLAESQERQNELLKQIKIIEDSNSKWRKNKKDMEMQVKNLDKCRQEITQKISRKTNDIRSTNNEIKEFQRKIESNKSQIERMKNSMTEKKKNSEDKIKSMKEEIVKLQAVIEAEKARKSAKEQEGSQYVKEAREDLKKIYSRLIEKKLEKESLLSEKNTILEEIEFLKKAENECKGKCASRQDYIDEEIKKLDEEIATHRIKCIQCHKSNDTSEVQKYCSDCPRCTKEIDCSYEPDHCKSDEMTACVCTNVKEKFLENVFENMYSVLERNIKSRSGKAVGEKVLECLRKSRNGKLDELTRQGLKQYVLKTVKDNLNLTIVGGAVKTRCEMEADTYKQLMLCLKDIKPKAPPPTKQDKATVKKDICRRWGGECNCPGGMKRCPCLKKSPAPAKHYSHPPTKSQEPEKDTIEDVECSCPITDLIEIEVEATAMKRVPCEKISGNFEKSMRAAQCMLGSEILDSTPNSVPETVPDAQVPNLPDIDSQVEMDFPKEKATEAWKDESSNIRDQIIEEVIGEYNEVTPIETQSYTIISYASVDLSEESSKSP